MMTNQETSQTIKWARSGESVCDIAQLGLTLLQKDVGFRAGTDAALLAWFVRPHRRQRVVDLGAGTGIIGLLLHQRRGVHVTAVEILPEYADMAARSVRMNGWERGMTVCCMDMRTCPSTLGKSCYDCVVCNPPYYKKGSGPVSPNAVKAQACTEQACTLVEMFQVADALLKNGGRLAVVLPAERAGEAIEEMARARLCPKRGMLVQPRVGAPPRRILLEGIKGGKPGIHWLPTLCVNDDAGQPTRRMLDIYAGRETV